MYKDIIQIIFVLFLVQSNLTAQNPLEIKTEVNGNYDEQRVLKISVIDSANELISFNKPLPPYISIPNVEVLENNNILILHTLEGITEIYSAKANLISKNEFYKLPPHNEQNIKYYVNRLGFVLLISEARKNNLYFFNNNGEEIFSKNVLDGLISGLVSTNDAELIAYSLMRWKANNLESETVILDTKTDSEIVNSNRFEKGTFNNEAKLFLGFTNNNTFFHISILNPVNIFCGIYNFNIQPFRIIYLFYVA